MSKLTQLKQKSWIIYNIWRKGSPYYCNALKEFVFITLNGWNHLMGTNGHKQRSVDDTFRRLMLLPLAKKIIDTSTTFQNVRRNNNYTDFSIESVEVINMNGGQRYRKVIVIIRKDTYGKCAFLSIMDRDVELNKK